MVDPAYALDPFPHYETLRAKGPLYDNGFAMSTVSHAVTTAVLRSPDFGVIGGFSGNVPRWLLLAQAIGGRGPLGPLTPPSLLVTEPPDHTRYRKLVSRVFSARAVERAARPHPADRRPSCSTGSTRAARSTSSRRTAACCRSP